MLRGIFALFFRSLRSDSRSVLVHLTWLFLLIVIYISLWNAQEQSAFYGAPGLNFFRSVIYLDAIFLTLLGISYFSSAISEEKEEDTLGMMTMAGISPLGILLGKSTTRLFQVFLLFAVQYPFTQLAVTLGGLMPDQIYSAYAALLAYTILLANAGLYSSVISSRSRDASGLTSLMVIGYVFLPLFALLGFELLKSPAGTFLNAPFWQDMAPTLKPILLWFSQTSIFGQLYQVTETGTPFGLTPQLITNSLGGLFFFLISWWMFYYVSHEPATEATTRAMVPKKTGSLRRFGAGRAWNWALVWKDFHFVAGGWIGLLIRCGLYIGLYWLSFGACYPWDQTLVYQHVRWQDVTYGYQMFLPPLFAVDCALCASRVFQEEIRHQTLASLLMLPRTVAHICYSKLAGCLIGLIPGIIALFTAYLMLEGAFELYKGQRIFGFGIWYVSILLLAIHLCMVFSLFVRWGALAMGSAVAFGCMILSVIMLETIFFSRPSPDFIGFFAIPFLLACVGCHLVLLLRLPALGEK